MIPIVIIIGNSDLEKFSLINKLINLNQNIKNNKFIKLKNKNYFLCFSGIYFYLLIDSFIINKYHINIEFYLNLLLDDIDIILFLINENLKYFDLILSNFLRKLKKYIFLIINKILKLIENLDYFNILGFGKPYLISIENNYNINYFINNILYIYCFNKICIKKINKNKNIIVSLVGRFGVGKSTLINYFINKNFINKFNSEYKKLNIGSVYIKYKNYYYNFINSFNSKFIYFNNINLIYKIYKIIIISNIVLFLLNHLILISKLDNKIYNFIYNHLINNFFIINKTDLLDLKEQIFFKNIIKKKLNIKNNYILFVSCLYNYNLFYIKFIINKIFLLSIINFSTNKLNKILNKFKKFIKIYYNYNIKINYIHQGGKNPPLIIIHSNNKINLKYCYKKFFKNIFYKEYNLKNILIKIKFKHLNHLNLHRRQQLLNY